MTKKYPSQATQEPLKSKQHCRISYFYGAGRKGIEVDMRMKLYKLTENDGAFDVGVSTVSEHWLISISP